VADAERHLRKVCAVLQQSNPKEDMLAKLRACCPGLAVIGVDVELLDAADDLKVRTLASALDQPDGYRESGYAVAGWFGRDSMNRLLRPPFATPLYLLLYGPEVSCHRAFTRRVR